MPETAAARGCRLLSVAAALCSVLAAEACLSSESAGDGTGPPRSSAGSTRTVHNDGEGPLSASSGVGGGSIDPPGVVPWYGTFGSFLLCSDSPGADLVLEGVRVEPVVAPLEVSTFVRTVTAQALAQARGAKLGDYAPFTTNWGSPPKFDEPYVQLGTAGRFDASVRGTRVNHSCSRDMSEDQKGFQELVLTFEVGEGGADVPDTYVDYRADGKPMTLRIRWRLVACGDQITDRDFCS